MRSGLGPQDIDQKLGSPETETTTTPQRPLRGDFQWFGISGAFAPTLDGFTSIRGYFGLSPEATYVLGTSRDRQRRVSIFMRKPCVGADFPRAGAAVRGPGKPGLRLSNNTPDTFAARPKANGVLPHAHV